MEAPKLEWMYRNSNEVVDSEEYLLGKPIDKAFEQTSIGNEIEKDCLPTSIFSNTSSNIQVDVLRKIKEDPLELIRQQEIERRKQLLKNPVQLKKLQNMLKAKQSKEGEESKKSKKKKKSDRNDDDSQELDNLLAKKYLSLMKKHGIKSLSDLSSLKVEKRKKSRKLSRKDDSSDNESDSDSESSSESDTERSKKNKSKRKQTSSDSSDSDNEVEDKPKRKLMNVHKKRRNRSHSPVKEIKNNKKTISKHRNHESSNSDSDHKVYSKNSKNKSSHRKDRQRKSSSDSDDAPKKKSHRKKEGVDLSSERNYKERTSENRIHRNQPEPGHSNYKYQERLKKDARFEERSVKQNDSSKGKRPKPKGLSEEDKQKKLEEMMSNVKWRDDLRVKNVDRYKKEDAEENKEKEYNSDFMRKQMILATSSGTVESRIKSNINNIQRSKFSMNENFARR